jgi:hypothetical protein
MRLTENARRSVVFIGHASDRNDTSTFRAAATGFFVTHEGVKYLVTAAHVAQELRDDPFDIRLSAVTGGADVISFDPTMDEMDRWFFHDDPTVDLALLAFPWAIGPGSDWDHRSISSKMLLTNEDALALDVGPGDTCYAVGLFKLVQGHQRDFPVVHRGSIAALAGDELLPVRDWIGKGTIRARAHLVEATNLKGLSGSPVLVRSSIVVIADRLTVDGSDAEPKLSRGLPAAITAGNADIKLLGVWSGSWDAAPDEVLALNQGHEGRVPVGLGVVVPSSRLLELLDSAPVKEQRRQLHAKYGTTAGDAASTAEVGSSTDEQLVERAVNGNDDRDQ